MNARTFGMQMKSLRIIKSPEIPLNLHGVPRNRKVQGEVVKVDDDPPAAWQWQTIGNLVLAKSLNWRNPSRESRRISKFTTSWRLDKTVRSNQHNDRDPFRRSLYWIKWVRWDQLPLSFRGFSCHHSCYLSPPSIHPLFAFPYVHSIIVDKHNGPNVDHRSRNIRPIIFRYSNSGTFRGREKEWGAQETGYCL